MSVRIHGDMTVAHAKREDLVEQIAHVTGLGPRAIRNQLDRVHGKRRLRVAFSRSWPSRHVELAAITAAAALEMDLAEAIAGIADLTPRQVRGRLNRVHGKTLVGTEFGAEWPSEDDPSEDEGEAPDNSVYSQVSATLRADGPGRRGRGGAAPSGGTARGSAPSGIRGGAAPSGGTVRGYAPSGIRGGAAPSGGTVRGSAPSGEQDGTEADDEDVEDLEAKSVADARRLDLAGAIADRTGLGVRKVRARLRAAHGNALVGNLFAEEWEPGDEEDDGNDARARVTGTRGVGTGKHRALAGESLVSGRFRLLRSLGKGGQGEAFEARDEQLPERGVVVIKFASFDTAAREFTFAMRFRHEHICQYFDTAFDAERNRRYLVIEHGGQSLEQFIKEHGVLAKSDAIPIITQAAAALDYAHSKNVIHHDVSPGNILIDAHGHVRVTDFGIAVAGTMRTVVGGNHTMVAKTSLGRHPFYAAPEMSTGEPVRGRADQYSLALVLCSLLEGEIFTRAYRLRDFQRLASRQNAALRRALSRKADDRFPSCVAFANALVGA